MGNPTFPARAWRSPSSMKENAMFAVTATRDVRAIGVLVGGSGRTRSPRKPSRPLAALLKPWSRNFQELRWHEEAHETEVDPR